MHCHRFAVAAAVIALPFALTACSSSGSSGSSLLNLEQHMNVHWGVLEKAVAVQRMRSLS